MGQDIAPVGHPYFDEPSEDVVVALLASPQLGADQRNAVLAACQDVYAEVLQRVATSSYLWSSDDARTLVKLSRVVDLTTPDELRSRARAFLELALAECHDPVILAAAVRAVMNYPKSLTEWPFWERVAAKRETAAYGISALIDVNAGSPRLLDLLVAVWLKQVTDHWAIDTAFLLRRAATTLGSSAIIVRVVGRVSQEAGWQVVAAELRRRPWSREWLRYVRRGHSRSPGVEPAVPGAPMSTQRLTGARIAFDANGGEVPVWRRILGRRHAGAPTVEVSEECDVAEVAQWILTPREIHEEIQA